MYADAAASSPLCPRVWQAMERERAQTGNLHSLHHYGLQAKAKADQYLATIAGILGVHSGHLVVTHGGTDANRRVLWALARRFGWSAILASGAEHSSIRDEIEPHNQFHPLHLPSLAPATRAVCFQYANNETGRLFDPASVRTWAKDALWLCDWVQATGKVPFATHNADFITFSAHKFSGPQGVGLLYVRTPEDWPELTQDRHTQSLVLLAGMAKAFELHVESLPHASHLAALTHTFESTLAALFASSQYRIHHADAHRIPGLTSLALRGVRAGQLMKRLSDQESIAVSTGSACNQDLLAPTPTIKLFESDPTWRSPIRVSFHHGWSLDDAEELAHILHHHASALGLES